MTILGDELAQQCSKAAIAGRDDVESENTCTAALEMAAILADIQPGDEVIMPSYTFVSTANAFVLRGATPVFVDIEPDTYNIDPVRIREAIGPKTKAVIPVHFGGLACDMDRIMAICEGHNVDILEDACQAHGSRFEGKKVGTFGQASAFSFYPTKNLGAFGDAGMVTSSDEAFVARVRQVANHGAGTHRYDNVVLGTNSRLDTLQAAVLQVKLETLEQALAARRAAARR